MVGVIVNPHAGRNRGRNERFAALRDIVGSAGVVGEPHSLEELEDFVRELRAREVQIVAICGGDGSFFRGLSALVRNYSTEKLPMFLPLRAGSMNTIARSVGLMPGSPEHVLESVLRRFQSGQPVATTERQLIRVNGDFYGFMVGLGIIVNFLERYYAGGRPGPVGAAYWLLRAILSGIVRGPLARSLLQGFRAEVQCDGELLPYRTFNVVFASTIEEIGLGFSATYLANKKPGFFHCLAGRVRARDVILRLWRLRHGCPLRLPSLYDNLVRVVTMRLQQPAGYTIDGDLLPPVSELRFEIGPRLTILQG